LKKHAEVQVDSSSASTSAQPTPEDNEMVSHPRPIRPFMKAIALSLMEAIAPSLMEAIVPSLMEAIAPSLMVLPHFVMAAVPPAEEIIGDALLRTFCRALYRSIDNAVRRKAQLLEDFVGRHPEYMVDTMNPFF